jgi:hypothetical protein
MTFSSAPWLPGHSQTCTFPKIKNRGNFQRSRRRMDRRKFDSAIRKAVCPFTAGEYTQRDNTARPSTQRDQGVADAPFAAVLLIDRCFAQREREKKRNTLL